MTQDLEAPNGEAAETSSADPEFFAESLGGSAATDGRRAAAFDPAAVADRHPHRAFRRVALSTQLIVRCRPTGGRDGADVGEAIYALRDVSCEGLSIWLPMLNHAPMEAGELCSLVVVRPDGPPISLAAEARSFEPSAGSAAFMGFRIRPSTIHDGAAWLGLLDRQLHPRVRTGSDGLNDVWALYEAAGYFALSGKRPEDFSTMKAKYLDATRRALEAPSIALQAVWPESGQPVATLSALHLYENAWLGFQMAKRTGPASDGTAGRLVLREIHLSIYERVQRDPGTRWIIGHTQVRPVWSRLCHHDFTARYATTKEAAIWRFRAIEINMAGPSASVAAGVSLGPATGDETLTVLQAWAEQRPEPLLEALDLVPRRFDLLGVRRRWWVAGLVRDRALLVVRHGGTVTAAIVLELADEGLHLFRLLDHALPLALTPDGEAYFPALLDAANEWYAERGRSAWACFVDSGTQLALRPGMFDMGEADMCITSTARMPEFFEHVHRITDPRAELVGARE